ncbi:MAG: hypothetical protein H6Q89_4147 [Myxococcaceae bacterium]|nr:hypothetical protein [Myxococcaceae bacterium]
MPLVWLVLLAAPSDYAAVKSDLAALRERTRVQVAQAATPSTKAAALATARAELIAAFDTRLFPAWAGTRWDFYGTTEVPREGKIACGYYVSTLLRDAGFKVERVKLAQQASEWIVRTLAEDADTLRFRHAELPTLLQQVRTRLGEGLFVVGMDYHVAFLRLDSKGAQLCHSAVFEPKSAVCEDAATSPGFASSYHVVGKLFADAQLQGWVEGQRFPVRR